MMAFEDDKNFLFPESKLLESDKNTGYYLVLDKTTRDSFFNRDNSDDDCTYGDAKWK